MDHVLLENRQPLGIAIAFECLVDDKWERIGYVIRQLLDSVHYALSESKITAVCLSQKSHLYIEFDWIVYWYKSGPGW